MADLDTVQPDARAEGENGYVYERGYFDESVQLTDGFRFSYTVQKDHHLAIDGEVYENDHIASAGVLTGDSVAGSAQPEKRLTSVILSQNKGNAQAIWRGCGSEYAPARTELCFAGGEAIEKEKESIKAKTGYTVKYVDEDTGEEIKDAKKVRNRYAGDRVTVKGPEIIGDYVLNSEGTLKQRLKENAKGNIFTFYYKLPLTNYTVRYLEYGTDTELAQEKCVTDVAVGSEITENAIDIADYERVGEAQASLILQKDTDSNVITFYYQRALTNYTVSYLEYGTDTELAPMKCVTDVAVNSEITESAIDIDQYELVGSVEQRRAMERDAKNNTFIFYYEKISYSYTVNYRVIYIDIETNEWLKEDKVVTGIPMGEHIIETACAIEHYIPLFPTIEWDANEDGTVQVFLYYYQNDDIN